MKENDKIIKVTIAVSGNDGLKYYNISHSDGTAEKNFLVETGGDNEAMREGATYLYEQHISGIEIDFDENLEDRDDGILQRFEWIRGNIEEAEEIEESAQCLANDAKKFRDAVLSGDLEGDVQLWGGAVKHSIENIQTAAQDIGLIAE